MIKIITNRKGEEFEILYDEQDAHLFEEYSYCIHIRKHTCYVRRTTSRKLGKPKSIFLHTDIMKTPKDMVVDHINGNGLDNRRENLEIVTQMVNTMRGKRAFSETEFRGVYWDKRRKKNPFKVHAWVDGKQKHLGVRPTRISAARFHDEVVEEEDGNPSRTNRFINRDLYDRLTKEENLGIEDDGNIFDKL